MSSSRDGFNARTTTAAAKGSPIGGSGINSGAGDAGADINDLMRDHFGGSHHSFGGTHSSIEKTWRARGGEAFAAKLIDDSADGSRQIMVPEARELVLTCVGLQQLSNDLADPR